jgi:leader peptidase (prepilin peptidase) / N-methyltransferase
VIELLARLWSTNQVPFWLITLSLAYFLWVGIKLSVIDLRTHLLPDSLVLPSYAAAVPLALAAGLIEGPWAAGRVLAAGAALWVGYFAIRFASPSALGFGDVKLAGVLGLYLGILGWQNVFLGTLAAFILAGAAGLVLVILRKATLRTELPLGPFMVAGAFAGMIAVP